MPFLDHFGLQDYPFALPPNVGLFFPTDEARALLAGLEFALGRGDGLLKIVGEVGTGKTMVANLLADRLKARGDNVAYFSMPVIETAALPAAVARGFGIKVINNAGALRQLQKFLEAEHAKGHKNVLIVDEAQTLGAEGLEAVRLFSNFEAHGEKLIQIVLFGQKELDGLLHKTELRQIAQRIQFSFMTQPMSAEMVADYVRFRLEHCLVADASRTVFSAPALKMLAKGSKGLPRVVHLLGDKALMAAYTEGAPVVLPRHVKRAMQETPDVCVSGLCLLREGWAAFKKRILGGKGAVNAPESPQEKSA